MGTGMLKKAITIYRLKPNIHHTYAQLTDMKSNYITSIKKLLYIERE